MSRAVTARRPRVKEVEIVDRTVDSRGAPVGRSVVSTRRTGWGFRWITRLERREREKIAWIAPDEPLSRQGDRVSNEV
jgi:hypothetical protein